MPTTRIDALTNAGIVVLLGCAVLLTGANTYRTIRAPRTEPDRVLDRDLVPGPAAERIGGSKPRVTLIVFSDYQCPACRKLSTTLQRIVVQNPADISISWRHWPLDIHPYARAASAAAICAARQGRFVAMHQILFDSSSSFGTVSWATLATAAGVRDTGAFLECSTSTAVAQAIASDVVLAHSIGAVATPTLVLGRAVFTGNVTDIADLLSDQLGRSR